MPKRKWDLAGPEDVYLDPVLYRVAVRTFLDMRWPKKKRRSRLSGKGKIVTVAYKLYEVDE